MTEDQSTKAEEAHRRKELYDPLLYSLLHRGTPKDAGFYKKVCEGARSVLELGCGYGRLTRELMKEGRKVVGLELHPGLLKMAKAQCSAELLLGDMRSFELDARFDRILIPHSGLYCLLSDDEVRACFSSVAKHLTDEGKLIFDAYYADTFHRDSSPEDAPDTQRDFVSTIAYDENVWQVFERSHWDHPAQRIDVTYEHEQEGAKVVEATIEHRYLLSHQIEPLLIAGGLKLESLKGNFEGDALTESSDSVVVTAKR